MIKTKKKKKRFDKWDIRFGLIILGSLVTMIITYILRTKQGIDSWYTSSWVTFGFYEASQAIFLASILAYVTYISQKALKNKR